MGWATGTGVEGRQIGYSVTATCDQDGCAASIDRGLAYVCGGDHGGADHGCGGYFCAGHLGYATVEREVNGVLMPFLASAQLCPVCLVECELALAPAVRPSEGDGSSAGYVQ